MLHIGIHSGYLAHALLNLAANIISPSRRYPKPFLVLLVLAFVNKSLHGFAHAD